MRFPYDTTYRDPQKLMRYPADWISYGLLAAVLLAAPWLLPRYYVGEVTFIFIMCVASLGLMVVTGFTGQVSLGHAAFVAIGAYTHTLLMTADVPFIASILLAGLFTGFVGLLVGMPAIRVSGLHLAMVTLAFSVIVEQVVGRWKSVTGGFTTPSAIARAGITMIASGELWTYLWPSLVVLVAGLALAAIAGIAIGLLLARYWALDVAFGVYITFLYSIPTVALVPLIVLWTGYEMTAKIVILFLFAFFPMAINTYQGVKNVDARLLEVGRAFRCNEWQLWTNIVIPGALPFIITGLRLAVGRGLIGMVLADLYTAVSGIGYLIVRTASTYQVDKMFVPIVTLGILGVSLTALLRFAEIKIAPWTAEGKGE